MPVTINFQLATSQVEIPNYHLEGEPFIGQGLLLGDMRFSIVEVQHRTGSIYIYALEENYIKENWYINALT